MWYILSGEPNSSEASEPGPPAPPIRSQSVSREKRSVPLPTPPADGRGSPQGQRRPPPVPPPPRRAASNLKGPPPPVPNHRRSRSEGRAPFGEEDIRNVVVPAPRPGIEKQNSVPLESPEPAPVPPPKPSALPTPADDDARDRSGSHDTSRLSNGELPEEVSPPR